MKIFGFSIMTVLLFLGFFYLGTRNSGLFNKVVAAV